MNTPAQRGLMPESAAGNTGSATHFSRWVFRLAGACMMLASLSLAGAEAVPAPAPSAKPTLYLIGDSTVRNRTRGQLGWGDAIAAHFDPARISVVNRALGGRSSRTYLTEGLWDKVLADLKPGDFVLMQFGHNDNGPLDEGRARASLKGVGDESRAVTNKTSGKVETVYSYGWYLRRYIRDAKAKGATPIVLSLVPRNIWKDGKVVRAANDFAQWAAGAAAAEGVEFVDLNDIVARRYEALGAEKVKTLFPDDHTHTNPEGARVNAACVAEGLRGLKACALTKFLRESSAPVFHEWAPAPPLGWNSWDAYATTVTEARVKAQADAMAEHLAAFGWQYIVVDIQWYEPHAKSFDYREGAPLVMDANGRLRPATNRFPSAVGGKGFKPLSDYVHGKGLKFGVHLLRGIPRQAVPAGSTVLGTSVSAAQIADTNSLCSWNKDMYGVDMSRPGAQAYYNSVFRLLADWGVDFVKVDDIARPYHKAEIEGIRKAIDATGRPMVLSLSPGETPVAEGPHVMNHANLWRVSDDFWDDWRLLRKQFDLCQRWTDFSGPGHYPDADMLPLGLIRFGKPTRFTRDEQFTLMTLWCIARSPLIFGGDLTRLDAFTLSLVTNREVIAVDQASSGNRELFRRDGFIAWVADVPGAPDRYLALFNTHDVSKEEPLAAVEVPLAEVGFAANAHARDLWAQRDLGSFASSFTTKLPAHGAGLFRLSGARVGASSSPISSPKQ